MAASKRARPSSTAPDAAIAAPSRQAPAARPHREGVRVAEVDHRLRVLARPVGLASPGVDQARVEVGVGEALRVVQALGELDAFPGSLPRSVGEALHPQEHAVDEVAHHPGVVARFEALHGARCGVVRLDALFELVDPRPAAGRSCPR